MKQINTVVNGPFVSLFSRFLVKDYNEHNTIEEAIKSLESGSDQGLIMEIAVIEMATKNMVWFSDFIGKEQCQDDVNSFLNAIQRWE